MADAPTTPPKFTQIVTGAWKGSDGNLNHTLYALGDNGRVYRFFINKGWDVVDARATSRPADHNDPF